MSDVRLSCPSCGTPHILDNPGIVTVVCQSCATTLYREAAALRAGERSIVGEPSSNLHVGGTGTVEGRRLRVVGRVHFAGAASTWDEWYGETEDGQSLWLVEDARRYTLEKALPALPAGAAASLPVGTLLMVGSRRYQVDERGEAVCLGGEGQLPRDIHPGETYRFVDLTEVEGQARLTMEFSASGSGEAFVGQDIAPEQVVFAPDPHRLHRGPEQTEAVKALNCPNCGGNFSLPAQGEAAQTATCPYCSSVLDIRGLTPRKVAENVQKRRLPFAVGAKASLLGRRYEVVGRTVYRDAQGWEYTEYLLWSADERGGGGVGGGGYLWLTEEAGNYIANRPTSRGPALAQVRGLQRKQVVDVVGETFRYVGLSRVELVYVDGALPWQAAVGDQHRELEFTAPPRSYCMELSGTEGTEELERFIGEHLDSRVVYAAFGKEGEHTPPREAGIATPNPVDVIWQVSAALMGGFSVLNLALAATMLGGGTTLATVKLPSGQTTGESAEFEVPDGEGVMGLHIASGVDNSWVYVDAELLDAETDAFIGATGEEVGYYHGVEGGESWTEGAQSSARYFHPPPGGGYVLSVEVEAERPVPVEVSLTVGERLTRYPLGLALLLLGGPAVIWLRWWAFERDRWDEDEGDD